VPSQVSGQRLPLFLVAKGLTPKCHMQFGKNFTRVADHSKSGWLIKMYFDLVVMLNISFIPTIEFPYSTGDPLLIMPSPMSWQLSLLGCCPVAG
jgi:hypothetical protein